MLRFKPLSGAFTFLALLSCSASAQTYSYQTISYPGAIATYISSMNESGTAVGWLFDSSYETHGLIYSRGVFTTVDLGSPTEGQTYLTSINAQGVILGTYDDPPVNVVSCYEISPNGVAHKLFTKPFLTESLIALNDAGNLLGTAFNEYFATNKGFLIKNGAITQIVVPGPHSTAPGGFNNRDHVVGSSYVDSPYNASNGFLFANRTYTVIQYPGQPSTNLNGINDYGVIVGDYNLPNSSCCQGFVDDNGVFTPFAVPNSLYTVPTGITNRGVIFGYYDSAANQDLAFIATPVP